MADPAIKAQIADLAGMYRRAKMVDAILAVERAHNVDDNMGGGWDCKCGIRWDWTDRPRAKKHVAVLVAESVDALLRDMKGADDDDIRTV